MDKISYFDLQKNYRVSLNKAEIISDLYQKKYDANLLDALNSFKIKNLIKDLEGIFAVKNDLKVFLEVYLSPDYFNAINRIVAKSAVCEETRSLIEFKEFLRLTNILLTGCNKEVDKLRRQVLVKKEYFEEWYLNELRTQHPTLHQEHLEVLLIDKKNKSNLIFVNCPNLCFIYNTPYYLVNLSS